MSKESKIQAPQKREPAAGKTATVSTKQNKQSVDAAKADHKAQPKKPNNTVGQAEKGKSKQAVTEPSVKSSKTSDKKSGKGKKNPETRSKSDPKGGMRTSDVSKTSKNTPDKGARGSESTSRSLFAKIPVAYGMYRISHAELLTAMRVDAKLVSSDIDQYCLANISLYDFAITMWEHVMVDHLGKKVEFFDVSHLTMGLVEHIVHYGLFYVIKQAQEVSEHLIVGNMYIPTADEDTTLFDYFLRLTSRISDLKTQLQFLRFLKRFSPDKTDLLEKEAIDSFIKTEKKCATTNKHYFGHRAVYTEETLDGEFQSPEGFALNECLAQHRFFEKPKWKPIKRSDCKHPELVPLNEVAHAIYAAYTPFRPCNRRNPIMDTILYYAAIECHNILKGYQPQEGYFSNGSIADGDRGDTRSHAAKLKAALYCEPGFLHNPVTEAAIVEYLRVKDPKGFHRYTYTCKFKTVPKSYKARRSIAMEEAGRAFRMQGIRLGLRKALALGGVNLDDQSINQQLAKYASVNTWVATGDLSAASDSVAWGLVQSLFRFDQNLFWEMCKWRSSKVDIGDRTRLLAKFATSGSPLCFEVESIVFISLLRGLLEYIRPHLSQDVYVAWRDILNVYGDDLIFPSEMFEMVKDVFEHLGFTINAEKSHYGLNDLYRESCGVEYYDGDEISSKYFPRKLLTFKGNNWSSVAPETIASIVSLQHRCVDMEWTNLYLSRILKDAYPDMTESEIGSPYDDLWVTNPRVTFTSDPKDDEVPKTRSDVRLIREPYYCRPWEVHYTLTTVNKKKKDRKGEVSYVCANALAYEYALRNQSVEIVDYDGNRVAIFDRNSSAVSLAGDVSTAYKKKKY